MAARTLTGPDGRVQTVREWAEEFGLTVGGIRERVKRHGERWHEVVPRVHLHTIDGRTQSIRQWALEYGVPPTRVAHRLKADPDRDIKSALEEPLPEYGVDKIITYNGRSQTVKAWAAEIGIKPATLVGRLDRGDVEAALSPYRFGARTITSADGRQQTMMAWAAELGITHQAMSLRLKRCEERGEPESEALYRTASSNDQRRGRPARMITSEDGRSQTIRQWARELGVGVSALRTRIWECEHAGRPAAEALVYGRRRSGRKGPFVVTSTIDTLVRSAASKWSGHRLGVMHLHQHVGLGLALLALLVDSREGLTPLEISLRLSVAPKVARAMLEALRDAGVPVAPETAIRGARWRIGAETREIDWSSQPLGKIADGQLAEQLGVPRARVVRARVARGIPASRWKNGRRKTG